MNSKKWLLIALGAFILALSPGRSFSQCNIMLDSAVYNGQTYLNPDTIQICLGESVSFYSHGGCPTYMMANDFDNGNIGNGWNSNASPMFNNPCGPGPNNTTYLWIGPATNFPRELITNPFAVTTQCPICFDMKYASQSNSSPCEGPDESTEGVHLQWSYNAGGPWLDINYWDPVGGYDPYLTTWHQYCENVPVNGTLYFRWFQTNTSGNDYDHWGLDNVQIFCPPAWQQTTITDNFGNTINTGQWNATVTPTQNTTYYVNVTDGTLTATDSIFISVYPPPTVTISGLAAGYCATDPAVTLTGSPTPGDFSGPGIIPPNTFDPSVAGPGTHTITYHHYYVATNPSTGVFTIFNDDFSTDKGWTGYGQGGWTRGSATASTGCSGGNDPAQDHTPTADNFIIGNYLGGCYPNSMAQTYWLTSPVINCASQNNCVLEFWSFSGCESSTWDHVYVDAYNGSAWQNIYSNSATFYETAWTLRTYPVPQAVNNPNFQVRFGMGTTDGSVTYMGWNIDDFAIKCSGTIMVTDTLCDFTTTQNVTIAPQPTSTFTVVSPVCINTPTTITYTGNAPANATYNWNFSGGTVHSGTGPGPYSVSWGVDNTYDITLTVTVAGCASQQTTQQVTVLPFSDPMCCQPPAPNAGTDAQVCSNTYTLQAIPSTPTGYWTSVTTGPQLGSSMNPICNAQITTYGTYEFVWHESTGPGCDNTDTVSITFTQQPIAEAGPTFNICSYTNTLNATPSVGTGTWTCNNPLVTFGNINLPNSSVTVPSDGQYTFVWTEDNSNGCISSDVIVANFAQQPNANAGGDNAVCQLSYTLQAIPSVGTGTWSVAGSGSAFFSNNHSPITSVDVNMTGIYNLVWTENNGLGCIDSDTVQIQMTLTPTSTFTTTNIPCFGDYSTITYTGNGTAQCTYNWNFSSGNVNPGTGPGPHTITWGSENTYTVTLQVSLNGCQSGTTSQQIIVPPALDATIQGIDLPCFGAPTGQVHLTVSGGTPVSGGNYYYLWNNGYLSEDLIDMPMGFYSVTVTDANGCTLSRNTYINEPPQLSLMVTPSHTICPGESTQLTIHPVGGSFPYEYFWNGALSGPTISVNPSQNTTYSAYVKDSHGCQSHTATTTISIHPPMQLIASANTDSICPSEPVLISFTASQGAGSPYIVTGSDGNIISSPYIYYPPYSTSYVVTARDVCNQTAIVEIPIFVYPLPPNAFLADTVSGCQPFTVHFNEISPNMGQTYIWDFGDNTNLSLAKNPVHVFQYPGVFDITLTVTSVDGCKTVNVVDSFITVNPKPNALFTYEPSIVSVLKPLVTFSNLSTYGYNYIWSFGTSDSSSLQNPVYRFPDVGTYPIGLIVITEYGCRDTAYASVMVRDEVTFYAPNAFSPDNDGTNDMFFVSGHGIDPATFYLAVYNRFGQIIWETNKWDAHNPELYGWNGKHPSGNTVQNGTYTWICTFNDFRGGLYEKAGTVTVIW